MIKHPTELSIFRGMGAPPILHFLQNAERMSPPRAIMRAERNMIQASVGIIRGILVRRALLVEWGRGGNDRIARKSPPRQFFLFGRGW